jgi:hypothetical protein
MEQFNKALSFVLGLVVVAVFIVVASGKINIKGVKLAGSTKVTPTVTPILTPKPTSKPWFSFFSKKSTATPTVTPTVRPIVKNTTPLSYTGTANTANQQKQYDPNYHSYNGSTIPTSIPNTGVPIALFPLFGTSLLTGIFLKKKGKE